MDTNPQPIDPSTTPEAFLPFGEMKLLWMTSINRSASSSGCNGGKDEDVG